MFRLQHATVTVCTTVVNIYCPKFDPGEYSSLTSPLFSALMLVYFQREGKIKTRWRQKLTPHTFLTWTTSKRHILTEITIQCCVSYLCLQPSHHLRGTASVHQDIPVPAGPAPPQASGLDVQGSTASTANPSGTQTFGLLNITIHPMAESNQRMEETNDFAPWSDQIRSAQAEASAGDEGAQLQLRQHQCQPCLFNTRTRSLTEANWG